MACIHSMTGFASAQGDIALGRKVSVQIGSLSVYLPSEERITVRIGGQHGQDDTIPPDDG